MAPLWAVLRSAVQEFRLPRVQSKQNPRLRLSERRRWTLVFDRTKSSSCCVSTRYHVRKRVLLFKYRKERLAASASAKLKAVAISDRDVGLLSGAEEESGDEWEGEGILEKEESNVRSFSTHAKEIETGRLSANAKLGHMKAMPPSTRWEDLGSPDWEATILTSSISMRPAFRPEDLEISSRGRFNYHRVDNRDWRLSYRSPQLLRSARWRLATLSNLMRTLSDRHARRTGKLTPLLNRTNRQPLMTQSLSSSPWIQHRKLSSTPRAADLLLKRYDNPFQDFLRQSKAERSAKFAQMTGADRNISR